MSSDTLYIIAVLGLIVVSEAFAQYFVKKCRVEGSICYFFFAVACYALVCLGLYMSYKSQGMGITNAIWSAASILAITLVGVVWYHETLNINDYIGIALVIAGIFFIFVKGHDYNSLSITK